MQGGDPFDYIGVKLRLGQTCLSTRSADEGGSDSVDGDVVFALFHGEALREVHDGGLGHTIHRFRR